MKVDALFRWVSYTLRASIAVAFAYFLSSTPTASWSATAPLWTLPPSEEFNLVEIERAFVYQPTIRSLPSGSFKSRIRICSWNIRRFSQQHLDAQIDLMARVISNCSIIAIQEIKNPIGSIRLWRHVQQASLAEWGYMVTPRTGRTAGEMEQYAFLWRADQVKLKDPGGMVSSSMARDPYHAFFSVTNPGVNAFDFALVVTHTKPGEISTELSLLLLSFRNLRQRYEQSEPDVILAGDINAGLSSSANDRTADRHFTALFSVYQVAISDPDTPTMVNSRFVNDNLLWDTPTNEDFANSSAVAAFDYSFVLSSGGDNSQIREALRISDHRLVWADFWTNHDSR